MPINVWLFVGIDLSSFAIGLAVGVVLTLYKLRRGGWKL